MAILHIAAVCLLPLCLLPGCAGKAGEGNSPELEAKSQDGKVAGEAKPSESKDNSYEARNAEREKRAELKGLSQDEVRKRLGNPLKVRKINAAPAPPSASDEEKEIFYRETGAERWAYNDFDVVFNMHNRVIGTISN
jgi:hypothetical protein